MVKWFRVYSNRAACRFTLERQPSPDPHQLATFTGKMDRVRVKNGYGLCTSTLSPSVIGRFDASSEKRQV